MSRLSGLAILLVLLFTSVLSFYQLHQQTRQDFSQQLATMNQVLAKASQLLLLDDGKQDINTLFSSAQHYAAFPVLSITLLDADKLVLSSTGLSPLLQQPESDWFAASYQVHWLDDRILSSQPVQLAQQVGGFLLLEVAHPPFPWQLWLWQMLIWLGLPCLLLIWLWQRASHRRSALEQESKAIEQVLMHWLANEPELPLPENHALSGLLKQWKHQHQQQQAQQHQQQQALTDQLTELKAAHQATLEQLHQSEQAQQRQEQAEKQCEHQRIQLLRQLVQTPTHCQPTLLQDLLLVRQESGSEQSIELPSWVGLQASSWRALLPSQQCLQLEEDSKASEYQLTLAAEALALGCRALLRLTATYGGQSQLSMQWQLDPVDGQLVLHLLLKGQSLPASLCQQLQQAPQQPETDPISDVQLFGRCCQQLQAEVEVSCLDELGSAIQLTIPVKVSCAQPWMPLPTLQLLALPGILPEAQVQSIKSACHQLLQESRLSHFAASQSASCPSVLALPEPEHPDAALFRSLLAGLHGIALAKAEHCAAWQAQSATKVLPLPQSATELTQALEQLGSQAMGKRHLLVVDDNETNQAFVQAMLASFPLHLTSATTGQQALNLCRQQRFDVILMDIQLPDLSGIEVTRQLRQLPAFQQIPILAFTAHALPDEVAAFKAAGMDDVVIKPLDASKLASLMRWCQPPPVAGA